jgi:hypothetical protein
MFERKTEIKSRDEMKKIGIGIVKMGDRGNKNKDISTSERSVYSVLTRSQASLSGKKEKKTEIIT